MDGYHATINLRKIEKEYRVRQQAFVIALSAHAGEEYTKKCYEVGMDLFSNIKCLIYVVSKPVNEKQLKDVLSGIFNKI